MTAEYNAGLLEKKHTVEEEGGSGPKLLLLLRDKAPCTGRIFDGCHSKKYYIFRILDHPPHTVQIYLRGIIIRPRRDEKAASEKETFQRRSGKSTRFLLIFFLRERLIARCSKCEYIEKEK